MDFDGTFPIEILRSEPLAMGWFQLILITCSFEIKHPWWVDQKKLFEDQTCTYTCTQKRKKHHLTPENQPFKKFENSPLPFGAVIPCSGVEMVGLGFRFSVVPPLLCQWKLRLKVSLPHEIMGVHQLQGLP